MARQRKESRSKKGTAGIDTALHLNFSTGAIYDLSPSTKKVFDYKYIEPVAKAYKITTSGEKYYLAEPGGQPQRLSTPTLYDGVTWRRACAAKRSIERMQEEHALKLELTDVFNENDA